VFDVRQRRVLHTVTNAHETAITTLELHPSGHCVLSGSASGDIKIWSLPLFREVTSLSKVHAKPSFLGDAASNILGDAASNMAINVVCYLFNLFCLFIIVLRLALTCLCAVVAIAYWHDVDKFVVGSD
jgi:WD40 repeat protein